MWNRSITWKNWPSSALCAIRQSVPLLQLSPVRIGRALAVAACVASLCVAASGDLWAAAPQKEAQASQKAGAGVQGKKQTQSKPQTKAQAKPKATPKAQAQSAKKNATAPRAATVYDNEPPVSSKELSDFLDVLPRFRSWAKAGGEEVHPQLTNGKADFLYSPKAADWVQEHGWQPKRFFCVMGRMAAAMVIVEEGNDMSADRPGDMPTVTQGELDLARKNLGSLLRAGGDAPAPAPAVSPAKYPAPQQFAAPRYAKP